MSVRCALVAFLAMAAAIPAGAQEDELADLLADEREEWRVSIVRFTGVDLDVENEYLTASIPRLLLEDLGDIEEHELSDETIRGYRQWIIEQAQLETGRRLTRARAARDDLLFDRLEPSVYRERYRERTEAIENLEALVERVRALPLNLIAVERRKPVVLVSDDGSLPTPETVVEYAEEEDVDLVIYGRVEQLEDYVYVEYFSWDRFRNEEQSLGSTAARPDEIYQSAGDIQADVAGAVLGRDWAHLRVLAPEGATVTVAGIVQGIGTTEVRYLTTGDVRVAVEAVGATKVERVITLLPFRTAEVELTPAPADVEMVLVTSEPAAADVYLQSIWHGRTPVQLPRPSFPVDVTLAAAGYRQDSFVLTPESAERIDRALVPLDRNWKAYIQERRDTFYRSIGAFALSVPVPVFLGALYDDARSQIESYEGVSPLDDANRLARRGNIYLYARYAALSATIGLLGNTLWQLSRYIRAAGYVAE